MSHEHITIILHTIMILKITIKIRMRINLLSSTNYFQSSALWSGKKRFGFFLCCCDVIRTSKMLSCAPVSSVVIWCPHIIFLAWNISKILWSKLK